ncbi:hypothetical protein M5D96_001630, partial [Drosophila gunungcola]
LHVTYAQYIRHTPHLTQAARSTKALRLAANKAMESYYCFLLAKNRRKFKTIATPWPLKILVKVIQNQIVGSAHGGFRQSKTAP